MSDEEILIKRCLKLARLAEGKTSPNPMVGAIVLNSHGAVIGEGFHQYSGGPHAEIIALEQATDKAKNGELYINLEPCCHYGKTPPCIGTVIKSGVKRVIIGMVDPNPLVAGQGIVALREAGIEVISGVCEEECAWLNRGFIKRVTKELPWLILKLATTLDGKIADRNGRSQWISGQAVRKYVHELRSTVDWVIIGAGTAITDNPQLDVRLDADNLQNRTKGKAKNPGRAVVITRAGLPSSLRMFDPALSGTTMIFCPKSLTDVVKKKQSAKTEVIALPEADAGLDLKLAMNTLAQRGANYVLCEGGGKLAAALLQAKLVDEIHWIIAPKILGDNQALPAVAGGQPIALDQSIVLSKVKQHILDEDVIIEGLPQYC